MYLALSPLLLLMLSAHKQYGRIVSCYLLRTLMEYMQLPFPGNIVWDTGKEKYAPSKQLHIKICSLIGIIFNN